MRGRPWRARFRPLSTPISASPLPAPPRPWASPGRGSLFHGRSLLPASEPGGASHSCSAPPLAPRHGASTRDGTRRSPTWGTCRVMRASGGWPRRVARPLSGERGRGRPLPPRPGRRARRCRGARQPMGAEEGPTGGCHPAGHGSARAAAAAPGPRGRSRGPRGGGGAAAPPQEDHCSPGHPPADPRARPPA